MKALILKAQTKELYDFVKSKKDVDKDELIDIHQKVCKIQMEVAEYFKKIG